MLTRRGTFDLSTLSDQFRSQWINPGDVFSILLILGGDIVSLALAQLAGSGFTPVAFSFGWVAYSISVLVSAMGSIVLIPQTPDFDCKVMNGKIRFMRQNTSWVLGRLMRDFEYWTHPGTEMQTQRNLHARWGQLKKAEPTTELLSRTGLVVTGYTGAAW